MAQATSPFLNQPLRSEEQARKDRLNREMTEREIARRLGHHGSDHLRDILDHAFRRIEDPAGSGRFVLIDANACAPNGVCLHGMDFEQGYAATRLTGEQVEALGRAVRVPVPLVGEV